MRNLKRHKAFSFINIFGLAVGMTCCILILLWVEDEVSFDRFHEKKERIHKVYSETQYTDGRTEVSTTTSFYPLAKILKEESPDVVDAVRYHLIPNMLIIFGEKSLTNNHVALADPSFFNIFTFSFVKGNPQTALAERFSVVITEGMSQKYFGTEDPMGKVLNVNNQIDLQVTGVIKNPPKNSSLQFDCVAPFILYFGSNGEEPTHWGGNPLTTFVLLKENAQANEVEPKVTQIALDYNPFSKVKAWLLHLQPLSRMHLYSPEGGGLIKSLVLFSVIAFFVLVTACINFMNLATARAATRANEVGLRKVVGAKKTDLITQFFGESIILSFIALIFSVIIIELLLPAFNNLTNKELSLNLGGNIIIILGLIGIVLFTGILSGSYPALFLSSFRPAYVLKGSQTLGPRGSLFRKILVVFQFSLSILLIIGTLIVYKQLNYIRNRDLGFKKENLIIVNMPQALTPKYETLKNEFLRNINVVNVTRSAQSPSYIGSTVSALDWDGKNPDEKVMMNWDYVDYDYFETLRLEIVQGRSFSKEFATDASEAFIVNEEAVKLMGMESPVGKRLKVFRQEGRIVGVVKNFHFLPLHHEIKPFVYGMNPSWADMMRFLFIRVNPDNVAGTLKYVEGVFKKFSPDYAFQYQFFNERIDQSYRSEQKVSKIVSYLTGLAVFISCLGLFGLASFMTERKTKEIGIRKVLGASVSNIVLILSKEFIKWVLVANIIAWPVAYFVGYKWLQNYAYRTSLALWVFIMAATLSFVIALLTVSYQAIKAALANPADTLRYE
jgi:ABC-type antimicrobial peptide transport system permease subunit